MVNNKSQSRYEIMPPLLDLGPAPGNNRALAGMTACPSDYFEARTSATYMYMPPLTLTRIGVLTVTLV
jgi:hypothetical protein